jgi:uncharacterized protein YecE (DUF72 family)
MTEWLAGCSGFHYKHWRGTFYPEKLAIKNWFSYYCEHFNALELNVTFYRFPKLAVFESWYDRSPKEFRFSVKAPRLITHFKKFNDTERMIADFYETTHLGLREKCGCYLFQLPPRYNYTEEKLEKILRSLDASLPNVVEFRDESWWRQEVYDAFALKNIAFCGMSHPSLPTDLIQNTNLLYYRFHGSEQLYASNYSDEYLDQFSQELLAFKSVKKGFIFFNNDINTFAVNNARYLQKVLSEG